MSELDIYKFTKPEQVFNHLLDRDHYWIVRPSAIGTGIEADDFQKIKLPDVDYNKHFHIRKSFNVDHDLHKAYEVSEIPNIEDFKAEALAKFGSDKIHQYISGDKVITYVSYSQLETEKEYLKRTFQELMTARKYYAHALMDKRFSLKGKEKDDQHKIEMTNVVRHNIEFVMNVVVQKLEELG